MKYIFTLITLLFFLGCDNTTEKAVTAAPSVTTIEMELNRSYIVYTGDRLEKTSDDAQISMTKTAQDDTTTVVLLQGSAQIIRIN
jgi:hypothetical protein